MEKTEIFKDIDQINAELKAPRAEAAKIQNLLDLIGEVQAPAGIPPAKAGMELVKDLVAGNIGTGYLQSVMVARKGEEILKQAIANAGSDRNGKAQDLDRFFLNEAGKVEPVEEQKVIEKNTFYIENEVQAEYIEKGQALVLAWNNLETFLQERKHPGIASNLTHAYNTERLLYPFRDELKDYSTVTLNLKTVNDFK